MQIDRVKLFYRMYKGGNWKSMNKALLMKNIIYSVYCTPGHRDVEQPRQLEVGKPACLSVTHHSLTGHTVCDILFGRKVENEKGRYRNVGGHFFHLIYFSGNDKDHNIHDGGLIISMNLIFLPADIYWG